jgi:hypothetical protein
MKLTKFDLTKNIGKPKAANLFRFAFKYMYSEAINEYPVIKPAGKDDAVTRDEYANRVHNVFVTGFTNGERFVSMGIYKLTPINGDKKKVKYVHHTYLGRTRVAAIAHLQCGVRKHWSREYEVVTLIERTMSLMNTMKIGTDHHEAFVQGAVGQDREAGSVTDTPAAD